MKFPRRSYLRSAAVAAACLAFFAAYAFLPLTSPHRYNSPDEASNAYFSRHFASSGSLWYAEPLNLVLKDEVVHPRSVRVVDNFLVPGGFIGLPMLYGGIAAALGAGIIPFLTPFFAVAAALAFAWLASRWLGVRGGLIAGAALLLQPAWWYAASRTLQPNVLFVAFVIFSAAMFFGAPIFAVVERRAIEGVRLLRLADGAIAGILLAAAVAVRMAEAYWLILGALVLLAVCRKRVPWGRLAAFAVTSAAALAPLLIMNQAIYGSPFATGYGSGVSVPAGEIPQGLGNALLGPLRPLLFPLGFAPRTAFANFWTYGIAFFWWWSVLVACGVVSYALARRRARQPWSSAAKAYAATAVVVTLWLILFYGSWRVQDNPDPDAVTIGSSYLRYWLPVFVFSTVPVAWLAAAATERLSRRAAAAWLAAAFVFAAASSATDVFWGNGEGLLSVRAELIRYDAIVREIVAKTPEPSLVIVDRADKYVWPDRPVITPLRADSTYAALVTLRRFASLYYFGITFPEKDLAWLRTEKLPPLGLTIEPVETFGEET
ncbi:MAG TPA: hypothetical protein VLC10_02415, partial [Patescibacteria group bacterium]|nr:hypothetical protein [Patescibacteria group bacterium]